jgi:hypothetical protein
MGKWEKLRFHFYKKSLGLKLKEAVEVKNIERIEKLPE